MAFESLSEKLSNVFKKLRGHGKLTEQDIKAAMREVRLALLEADVNYKVVKDFVSQVSERASGSEVLESLTPAQQVIKIVNDELIALMGSEAERLNVPSGKTSAVILCGLQGAGKTTNGAKLAGYFKKQGRRPLLAACDVYRPAAINQLKVVGEQVGVPVFEMGQGDPVEIAARALAHARDHGNDIVFIDTAGRLHIDDTLMDELKAIKAAVNPSEVLFFVDAMTGQDAVNSAEAFNSALEISGVVLTKTDGDTRGGAALSIRAVTGKPIKFIGTGEKLDQIEPFHPDRMASRILGMGDMLSLIEKAQQSFDEQKVIELEKKMKSQTFSLDDFLEQMEQVQQIGSLSDIMGMLPGMNSKAIQEANVDDSQFAKVAGIIHSMTKKERDNPDIISYSRKKRIAAGCGRNIEEVNRLLKQFEQMRKMMKQLSSGNMKKMMRGFGGFPGMS